MVFSKFNVFLASDCLFYYCLLGIFVISSAESTKSKGNYSPMDGFVKSISPEDLQTENAVYLLRTYLFNLLEPLTTISVFVYRRTFKNLFKNIFRVKSLGEKKIILFL